MTSAAKIHGELKSMHEATEKDSRAFRVLYGENGAGFVPASDVQPVFHATDGNEKTGKAGNYNLPIEITCDHRCECYRDGDCYACSGCYLFPSNQADYSENYRFFMTAPDEVFIAYIQSFILHHKLTLFRWFTCGDIPNARFLRLMVAIAESMPDVEFWAYTKKYAIVNAHLDETSGYLPSNLVILFSHWMNKDGSYFPMENPYNLPTSEFIPLGREDLEANITHVCPCSDPDSIATCATCETPCYRLKRGQSMGLREHSTSATKARDAELKVSKAALKEAAKAAKKAEKEAAKAAKKAGK